MRTILVLGIAILFPILVVAQVLIAQNTGATNQQIDQINELERLIKEKTRLRGDTSVSSSPTPRVLLAGVLTAPPQATMPKDPKYLKFMNCTFHNIFTTNPYFECMHNGEPLHYYKFGHPPTDSILKKFDDAWGVTERKTVNPWFEDIREFYNQGKPVPFNISPDLRPPMPAAGISRFHMLVMDSQIEFGELRTRDGTPLSKGTLDFSLPLNQPGIVTAHVMRQSGPRADGDHYLHYIEKQALPRPQFIGGGTGAPSISKIFQLDSQGPASRPTEPIPQTGGLGGPVGGGGSVFIGSAADWLAAHSGGGFSGFVEAGFNYRTPKDTPDPKMSPDGNAFYFYFPEKGILFAIVITDVNKDGIYEAHPVILKLDPKYPGIAFRVYEYPNDKALHEDIKKLRNGTLSTPTKK